MRGYDRAQVDQRIQELVRQCRTEKVRADSAEGTLQAALQRVQELEDGSAGEAGGFGARVERVLKMAEREAAELRSKATAEAAEAVEQARAEAEQHRHQSEQALIARAAVMDQEAAQRSAALNEREREIAEKLDAARQEAESIRGVAEREAGDERAKAERHAAQVVRQAEEIARQQREAATREVERLASVQAGIRAEMARLHTALGTEIDPGAADAPSTAQLDRPSPRRELESSARGRAPRSAADGTRQRTE